MMRHTGCPYGFLPEAPVDPRTIRSAARSLGTSSSMPFKAATRRRKACSPASPNGVRIVVKDGEVNWEAKISSKPIMLRSSGTRSPASAQAVSNPIAITSLNVRTALTPEARTRLRASAPPSNVGLQGPISTMFTPQSKASSKAVSHLHVLIHDVAGPERNAIER